MIHQAVNKFLYLGLLAIGLPLIHAKLELAHTLGSHMVLQRGPQQAAIYGQANMGSDIRVALIQSNQHEVMTHIHTIANDQGDFMALLPPQPAGGPYVVSNKER